jgi:hypothetical protein
MATSHGMMAWASENLDRSGVQYIQNATRDIASSIHVPGYLAREANWCTKVAAGFHILESRPGLPTDEA